MLTIVLLQINASTEVAVVDKVQSLVSEQQFIQNFMINVSQQFASYEQGGYKSAQTVSKEDERFLRVIQLYESQKKREAESQKTTSLDWYSYYKPWVDVFFDLIAKVCTLKWFKDSFFSGAPAHKECTNCI